jgi:hypothetical protein
MTARSAHPSDSPPTIPGTGHAGHAGRPQSTAADAVILTTFESEDLRQAILPHVQAVICVPRHPSDWLTEVAEAVQLGGFRVERTERRGVTLAEIDAWIDTCLPWDALGGRAGIALRTDLHDTVALASRLTGAEAFTFRALTDLPNARCGFHVDTVPPGAPTCGVLRVFCGATTDYVLPDNVTGVRDFYRFLAHRERLVRDASEAAGRGDTASASRARDQCAQLDTELQFLARPQEILTVPPGAVVCFKCIEVSQHWSDHPKASAWIHRSPMSGNRRFVLNVSAAGPPKRHIRPRRD